MERHQSDARSDLRRASLRALLVRRQAPPRRLAMFKKLAREAFAKAGYEVFNTRMHHARDGLYTRHKPTFLTEPAFMNAYQRGIDASNGVDPGFHWRVHIA